MVLPSFEEDGKQRTQKITDPELFLNPQRFHYNLYFSYKFLYQRHKNCPLSLLHLQQHNAGFASEKSRRNGWTHNGSVVDTITGYPE